MTATNTPASPFALPELLGRCMGNTQIASLLLDKFEQQLQRDVREMEQQLTAHDATRVAKIAHALKGAAGAVAAAAVRDKAAAVEASARENDLGKIASGLKALADDVDQCLKSLPDVRQNLAKSQAEGAKA